MCLQGWLLKKQDGRTSRWNLIPLHAVAGIRSHSPKSLELPIRNDEDQSLCLTPSRTNLPRPCHRQRWAGASPASGGLSHNRCESTELSKHLHRYTSSAHSLTVLSISIIRNMAFDLQHCQVIDDLDINGRSTLLDADSSMSNYPSPKLHIQHNSSQPPRCPIQILTCLRTTSAVVSHGPVLSQPSEL